MQFKLNKKSNYLVLKHKEGREEYEIDFVLNTHDVANSKLSALFEAIKKYPGQVVVMPNLGFIFKDEDLISAFTYLNGLLLKEAQKVLVATQGNFSLGNLGFTAFGENIDYFFLYTPKVQVGLISPFINLESFKPEKMPEQLQDAPILLAKETYAQSVLSQDYPIYIFWGDNKLFEQTTGITEYDKKETITIKKVDKNALTRNIYFLI